LLQGRDPLTTLEELLAARGPLYADSAHHRVDSAAGLPEQVAERVAIALRAANDTEPVEEVRVELAERSYPVLVGPGAAGMLAAVLPDGIRRVAVVSQASIPVEVDPGVEHRSFVVGEGEAAKTLATVEALCRDWAAWGLSRADCVVAVGGGVVTDVAGFAASVYHRGIPVVHVSTTLLGQVDAAVGGKTGVNLPEGKNLLGAFWQPTAVLCDTDTLATLPEREYRSGMGELAKYHFLGGGDLDQLALPPRVARAVRIKAEVVSGDEREGGRRAILNYGHTLAHALETAGGFDLRHGEAVAIGLIFAAELSQRLGRIDDARVAEHRRVVAAYDLPSALPGGADADQLIDLMGRDKKALRGLTFVLDGPAGVEPVSDVNRHDVEAAFEAVGRAS
jgi:5-deoxy-5-amino-3-dehydroquinate synthase